MAGLLKEIRDLPLASTFTTSDFLHIKQGDADRKITWDTLTQPHYQNFDNPHNVAKDQLLDNDDVFRGGLSEVTNDAQLKIASEFADFPDAAALERARTNLEVDSSTEVTAKVDAHAADDTNPHDVTALQVGLGNVNDWGASDDYLNTSDTTYATIGAVNDVYNIVQQNQVDLEFEVKMHFGFAGQPPTGFLEIAGQDANQLQLDGYPKLAQYVRDNFAGDKLPDTRGLFPRGWDNGAGIDPDTGRAMGSVQQDGIKEHNHTMQGEGAHDHDRGNMEISGFFGQNGNCGTSGAFYKSGSTGTVAQKEHITATAFQFRASRSWSGRTSNNGNHTHVINNTGISETRPKNFAIMFVIRHDVV